jgi:hypothetical protein
MSTFREEDFMAEFDGLVGFAALDQIGVGFEDGIDLVCGGNLLSIDNTSSRLIDNLICQQADLADFLAHRLDG